MDILTYIQANSGELPSWIIAIGIIFQWFIRPLFKLLQSKTDNQGVVVRALADSDKASDGNVTTSLRILESLSQNMKELVEVQKSQKNISGGIGKVLNRIVNQLDEIQDDTMDTRSKANIMINNTSEIKRIVKFIAKNMYKQNNQLKKDN